MSTYKLIYFNLIGRGEVIRLLFKMADVDFEDNRIELDQFTQEMKADAPFGQLPVLEVDGVKLCQSNACARYLARKFNMAGKTDMEQAQVDMIADCFEDTIRPLIAFFENKDETAKAAGKKKYVEEQLPAFLTMLEKLLTANHGGDKFFVGEQLTWVDLQFIPFQKWISHSGVENPLANYPKLAALLARIESIPKIADWLEKRPKTAF